MSQIRCFFLLTIILGLCCIIECGADKFQRESSAAKEEGQDANTKNSPRREHSCHYPYRSNKPDHCEYYILFGEYTEGNKRVSNKVYSKPKNGSHPLEVEVVYNSTNHGQITYIYVEDSKQSKRIWDDNLTILEGGIDDEHVKLIIKSDHANPSKYRVAIYANEKKN